MTKPPFKKIVPQKTSEILAGIAERARKGQSYTPPVAPAERPTPAPLKQEAEELAQMFAVLGTEAKANLAKFEEIRSEFRALVTPLLERAEEISQAALGITLRSDELSARAGRLLAQLSGEGAPTSKRSKPGPRFEVSDARRDPPELYFVEGWFALAEAVGLAENTCRTQVSAGRGTMVARRGLVTARRL